MCLAHYFLPNATSFPPFRQMSNSEYRAPPNDRARYDMQKELLGTNVTVKLLQPYQTINFRKKNINALKFFD